MTFTLYTTGGRRKADHLGQHMYLFLSCRTHEAVYDPKTDKFMLSPVMTGSQLRWGGNDRWIRRVR